MGHPERGLKWHPSGVTFLPSADGVQIALHELAGESGADHPVVLFAHATGFHARAYLPVARALAPGFHSFGADLRGHGESTIEPGWDVDWWRYGDDALAAAQQVAGEPGAAEGIVAFGHSMGGTALLMAARAAPALFRLLVLFEPIIIPTDRPEGERPQSTLPAGSRRRRETFPSVDAAIDNFASKPPMQMFDPDALDAYVRYGFAADAGTGGVRLKCDREHEARTFEQGAQHRAWDDLPAIDVSAVVVAGVVEGLQPAFFARGIADRLPNGRYVELPELDHFAPMTHPRRVAELIADYVAELDDMT